MSHLGNWGPVTGTWGDAPQRNPFQDAKVVGNSTGAPWPDGCRPPGRPQTGPAADPSRPWPTRWRREMLGRPGRRLRGDLGHGCGLKQGAHSAAHGVHPRAQRHHVEWTRPDAPHPQSRASMGSWNRWLKHLFAVAADEGGCQGLAYTPSLRAVGEGPCWVGPSLLGVLGRGAEQERASSCCPHLVGGPGAGAAASGAGGGDSASVARSCSSDPSCWDF